MLRNLKLVGLVILVMLCNAHLPIDARQTSAPITQAGPYQVGLQKIDFTDSSRDNRLLHAFVWYPAHDNLPDTSHAPYPLVFYSHGWTGTPGESLTIDFIEHLVSEGFVVAAVDHHDQEERNWPPIHNFVDRPLDILFLLNQLANLKDSPLAGLMNTDNVGVIGYSLGGYTTLTVAGARIDLAHLKTWCSDSPGRSLFNYCYFISIWDQISAYRDTLVTPSQGDLLTATTDKRIKAILPIAPCGGPFWGEKGLAPITIPSLIVGGTEDINCPYDIDAAYIYDHLASGDHYLITLEGRKHLEVPDTAVISYYETAFFGYYLQGKSDYAKYLTPESANEFSNATLKAQIGSH